MRTFKKQKIPQQNIFKKIIGVTPIPSPYTGPVRLTPGVTPTTAAALAVTPFCGPTSDRRPLPPTTGYPISCRQIRPPPPVSACLAPLPSLSCRRRGLRRPIRRHRPAAAEIVAIAASYLRRRRRRQPPLCPPRLCPRRRYHRHKVSAEIRLHPSRRPS